VIERDAPRPHHPGTAALVVEVSVSSLRVRVKPRIYGEAGVPSLWLVEPLARTLEIYRRDGDHWVVVAVHGGDEVVRAEPFDAVELALARWWLPDATG
jgi:Uma2 family endonuclease